MIDAARSFAFCLCGALLTLSTACAPAGAPRAAAEPLKDAAVSDNREIGERITIVGVRATQGDAVECPQIRADDGATYGVAYLEPSIALGARVSVTGVWAISARCRGRVINAEAVEVLSGD